MIERNPRDSNSEVWCGRIHDKTQPQRLQLRGLVWTNPRQNATPETPTPRRGVDESTSKCNVRHNCSALYTRHVSKTKPPTTTTLAFYKIGSKRDSPQHWKTQCSHLVRNQTVFRSCFRPVRRIPEGRMKKTSAMKQVHTTG